MTVANTTLIRDAVFNAIINANRKKGKPFRKLWQKYHRIDKETREDAKKLVLEIEQQESEKGWIQKILANSPIKKKKKTKGDK